METVSQLGSGVVDLSEFHLCYKRFNTFKAKHIIISLFELNVILSKHSQCKNMIILWHFEKSGLCCSRDP